jgi:hypothetical protein
MTESEEVGRLRNIIYRILLERGTLMATIDRLKSEIKQLESDVTALVNAHNTCPTVQQVEEAVASVQALSRAVKVTLAKDVPAPADKPWPAPPPAATKV